MDMQTEPARIIGLITTAIGAGIPLVAVSLGWTDQLAETWQQFLVALVPLFIIYGGFELTRSKVVSPKTYAADVDEALHKPPPGA
jgi:hypothetical protein